MTEIRNTNVGETVGVPDDDEEFTGYMGYGDGAIVALEEREGHDTIMARERYVSVFENLEEALGKWLNYVFGGEEDGDSESQS